VIIAVDFDGTVVSQDRSYDDVVTPLEFLPGAREALLSLKRAGHVLLLWSVRASRAHLYDPALNPLVRAGIVPLDRKTWRDSRHLQWARYHQMVDFVDRELPGTFDAIDDGLGGKPSCDLFIDDKAMIMRGGATWARIARQYGEPDPLFEESPIRGLLDRPVESLNLVPTGRLKEILDRIHDQLVTAGIAHYEPTYMLGPSGFWAADRATTVNLPWFLATNDLRDAAFPRYPITWENVERSIRHEVGHSVNYAFELWKRPDWTATFGDFTLPYPDTLPQLKDPLDPAFVRYMSDVEPGYPQRHPDEAWAEAFACWLDPESNWRQKYAEPTGAREKLEYVDQVAAAVLGGYPTNHELGVLKDFRAGYPGQTVRQALGLPAE